MCTLIVDLHVSAGELLGLRDADVEAGVLEHWRRHRAEPRDPQALATLAFSRSSRVHVRLDRWVCWQLAVPFAYYLDLLDLAL